MRKISKVSALIAVVGISLAAGLGPASAADSVTQAVTGGSSTASVANLALTSVTSTHSLQNSTGTMTLAVDDSTGTGAGWNVTEAVSAFAFTGGTGSTAIPAANFSITSVGAVTSSAGQAIDINGTQLAPTGPQSGTLAGVTGTLDAPVKVIRAGVDFGQGTYSQPINVNLAIPADSRAGTYTGTLTTTISAAP
jgi:hypothetical protein